LPLKSASTPHRDDLEIAALDVSDKHNIPVLGICRGSQILNVF
jgi:gamma-glutamyl-gamma-aminobutyrate hydrolase PuuD